MHLRHHSLHDEPDVESCIRSCLRDRPTHAPCRSRFVLELCQLRAAVGGGPSHDMARAFTNLREAYKLSLNRDPHFDEVKTECPKYWLVDRVNG